MFLHIKENEEIIYINFPCAHYACEFLLMSFLLIFLKEIHYQNFIYITSLQCFLNIDFKIACNNQVQLQGNEMKNSTVSLRRQN